MRITIIATLAAFAVAAPALAQDKDKDGGQPAATRDPNAEDVAMTPITDLNLSKDEIPAILLTAARDPYASAGLAKCPQIQSAIAELDGALGPDMDVIAQDPDRLSTGKVAQSLVGSLIPFRGVLRELTGAAGHQREFQAAIYAGAVRRGFLKGLGQQKGCAYPARPAFARVVEPVAQPSSKKAKKASNEPEAGFVSQPVIQPVPGAKSPKR